MTEADICSILHIWGCVLSFLKEGNWRWGLVCWVLCANCKGLPAAVSTCLYTVSLHLCQDYVLFVFLSWVGTDRWTNIEGYIPSSAGVWIGWFHLISFPFLNNHSFIHSFFHSFIKQVFSANERQHWSECNLWELALSFHHVSSKDWTLVIRFGGKCLYIPSHLTGYLFLC